MSFATIGARLRTIRKIGGHTLREVSEATGLSTGFLSLVENGKTNISFASLVKLANFMGLKPSELLAVGEASSPVLIRKDQRLATQAGSGVTVEWITWSLDRKIQVDVINIDPGSGSGGPYSHEGEEFAFVLEGEIAFLIGDNRHTLSEGDTVYFDSNLQHEWENTGATVAKVLFVTTPPVM